MILVTSLKAQHRLIIDETSKRSFMNVTQNPSIYYAPLNGLIWASSATINQHFYVFGGRESNNENVIHQKDRV